MWSSGITSSNPPVEINPKKVLTDAFTECEKAMLESAKGYGFFDAISKNDKVNYKQNLIQKVTEDNKEKKTCGNMAREMEAIFEGGYPLEETKKQILNLHFKKHSDFQNLFVLTKVDQFDKVIEILKLKMQIENLKKEVGAKTEKITKADFEDFIARGNAIIAQFRIATPSVFVYLGRKEVIKCEIALRDASSQVAKLYPRFGIRCSVM